MIDCTLTRKSKKKPEEFGNKAGERTTVDSLLQNEGDRVRGKVGQTRRRRGICTTTASIDESLSLSQAQARDL